MVTIGILLCSSCCCHCLAPSQKHRKIVILLLQLLLPHYPAPAAAATAKLQASATLNPWPHGFATPKHHLISCRNGVQKCTAKMFNVTSESLEKTSKNRQNQYSSAPAAAATAKLQASALNPWPHGFATPKHHLISCRNDVQKCTAKMSNVTSESVEKRSKNRHNRHSFLLQLLLPLLSSKRKTSKHRHSSAPALATTLSCSNRCCHCQAPGFSNSQALATRLRHIKTPPNFVPKLLLQLLLPLPSSKLQLRTSPHTSFVPKCQAPDFSSQPLATRLRHTKTPPNFVPKRRPKMHGENV